MINEQIDTSTRGFERFFDAKLAPNLQKKLAVVGPKRRRRSGTTLIEVLVAIYLISMTAFAVSAMMPMSARTEKMLGNHQQAASIVQHKIDQLRGVGYGRLDYVDLKAAGIIDSSPSASPFSFTTTDTLSNYFPSPTGTITIADFSSSIRQVTVTLTWTHSAYRQGTGTLTAVALIAND